MKKIEKDVQRKDIDLKKMDDYNLVAKFFEIHKINPAQVALLLDCSISRAKKFIKERNFLEKEHDEMISLLADCMRAATDEPRFDMISEVFNESEVLYKVEMKLDDKQLKIIDLQTELESAAKWDNAISMLVGKKTEYYENLSIEQVQEKAFEDYEEALRKFITMQVEIECLKKKQEVYKIVESQIAKNAILKKDNEGRYNILIDVAS